MNQLLNLKKLKMEAWATTKLSFEEGIGRGTYGECRTFRRNFYLFYGVIEIQYTREKLWEIFSPELLDAIDI